MYEHLRIPSSYRPDFNPGQPRGENFSSHYSVQPGSGVHSTSFKNEYWDFLRDKVGQSLGLATLSKWVFYGL